jgi:plasmid segregation protein ParM
LEIVKTLALASLARLDVAGDVVLVTGLPVAWYDDHDMVEAELTRTFDFVVNGKARTINVTQTYVVPQPFGTLFRALLNDKGEVIDPQGLARREVAIIDVGTYTTDYSLSDRLRYVEPRSGSTQNAMAEVYRLLQRAIASRYDLDLPLHKVERAFREGSVTLMGKTIQIQPLISEAIRSVGDAVVAHAESLWPDRARSYARVMVTGGGGAAFYELLRSVYPHAHLAQNAQLANAQGFQRYGQFKMRRSI